MVCSMAYLKKGDTAKAKELLERHSRNEIDFKSKVAKDLLDDLD